MVQWHTDIHKRKQTGGRRVPYRKKREYEMGGEPALTLVGDRKINIKDARGGNIKVAVLSDNTVNVYNPITRKVERTTIIKVKSNPSNRDYDRRGVITRGTIIETPSGDAKVTSRPGQNGTINAILISPAG